METKPTQNQMIAAHLNEGHTITPIEALNMFGCFRLGARIADLKKQGMHIETEIVHDKATGKHWASYRLVQEKASVASNVCPFGHYFGDEHDNRADCARCPESDYKKCKEVSSKPAVEISPTGEMF